VAKQKPPLPIWDGRVRTLIVDPDGKPVESVAVFSPAQRRREGMEEARFKKHVLGRKRLAVVYNVVKHIIGKEFDVECADRCFGTVNAKLKLTRRHIIVDIIRKEPFRARRRDEADRVKKMLAPYPTKSALAKTIARIRKRLSVP
jgi:hypothetical protein